MLSRSDAVRVLEKLPEREALAVLRAEFAKPENIETFTWFCFGEKYLTLPSPEFHSELYDLALEPGFKAAAAPRGFAKSTVVNLGYAAWLIANEFEHFIIIISDTQSQAVDQVETLADAITTSRNFVKLYGDLRTERWSRQQIDLKTGIRVVARGMGQKIRGLRYKQYRPGQIIIDDLENDEAVASSEQRKKTKRWFTNSVLPALSKEGSILMIGTILHHDSLLNNIVLRKGEFAAWMTELYKAVDYSGKVPRSLWPELWSAEELGRMRSDPTFEKYLGSIVFAQEYQNEPFSEEDAIIRPDWIRWVGASEVPPLVRKVMPVDPAISKKEKADFTAKGIMGIDADGRIYVTALSNRRMSFSEGLEDIRKWHAAHKPGKIGIESVNFQQAFSDSLKGLPIAELLPDKDKVRRTIAVSRYFEAGLVHVVRDIPHAQELFDQLTEFPAGAHDDMVDMAVYGIEMLKAGVGKFTPRSEDAAKPVTSGLLGKKF